MGSDAVAINGIPDEVPITWTGGDTLTFSVTAPSSIVDGMEWLAQVRSAVDAPVDATFQITPPTVANGPAYLTLPASETARLTTSLGRLVRVVRRGTVTGRTVQQYQGVWDVQVAAPGGLDPVRTLAKGTLTLQSDVSRAVTP